MRPPDRSAAAFTFSGGGGSPPLQCDDLLPPGPDWEGTSERSLRPRRRRCSLQAELTAQDRNEAPGPHRKTIGALGSCRAFQPPHTAALPSTDPAGNSHEIFRAVTLEGFL